ncbi:hypothetical protein Q764_08725 [Flavobacterium suncheonense GH29-5 = DSM 17707]|uniref:Uncharacterized protein n=1 Tax=Flavobacterium suncheonense GH29-5 = DSM 17707 TaxID=1121899 RepID=A0A0A2MBZ8_9FLAO|nr:hypothetical protein Q764_08725 [Flavobacterium suncheonense GH29-5 = DSM 17707]
MVVIIIGGYLKFCNKTSSTQFDYRRLGTYTQKQTIDGNGTLILGALLLLVSLWMYNEYKTEKTERDERKEKEELEFLNKHDKDSH